MCAPVSYRTLHYVGVFRLLWWGRSKRRNASPPRPKTPSRRTSNPNISHTQIHLPAACIRLYTSSTEKYHRCDPCSVAFIERLVSQPTPTPIIADSCDAVTHIIKQEIPPQRVFVIFARCSSAFMRLVPSTRHVPLVRAWCKQAMPVWVGEHPTCAPSRHCRGGGVSTLVLLLRGNTAIRTKLVQIQEYIAFYVHCGS